MKKQNSCQGVTMVEVIVAFLVLMIVMAIFSQAVSLTGRVIGRSTDILEGYRDLQGAYYLEDGVSGIHLDNSLKFSRLDLNGNQTGESFSINATVRRFYNAAGEIWDVEAESPAGGGS